MRDVKVDMTRGEISAQPVPAGSLLMHIVLTDDELAMSRLEIVPWERQLDADGSVLPVRLPAYMASRLTLFCKLLVSE